MGFVSNPSILSCPSFPDHKLVLHNVSFSLSSVVLNAQVVGVCGYVAGCIWQVPEKTMWVFSLAIQPDSLKTMLLMLSSAFLCPLSLLIHSGMVALFYLQNTSMS